MEPRHTTSMIIAESGSDWPGWCERFQAWGDEVILVEQRAGESLSSFAQRVRAKLRVLETRGPEGHVVEAVLVGGGRSDSAALESRSLILRAVASHMGQGEGGDILLDHHGTDRFAMQGLAGVVASMVQGSGVRVAPAAEAPAVRRVA